MGFLSGLFGKKNGRYETYHENGQLQFRGVYVAGKPDGPFESYYENGQLKAKSTYMAGELGGPYELYHENGQLRLRGTYDMGVQCGEWFEDGKTVTYDPCPPGPEDGN
jgi:antitoxin component YwqK of YwqJK toxin-antitoxin module